MLNSCILLICCVLFQGIQTLSADEENKTVHYVAIDIDDIFQPNWDSELYQIGTVKMNGTDVEALIELTHNLRSLFGDEFSFSIGYNSGYYDSTNTGDKAFINNASYFTWFNHLSFHQHILQYSYTYEQIEELIIAGKNFENAHGLTDFTGSYMVTPLHDGLWNPYDPIYDIFEKYGIYYSSTPMVNRPASYGNVKIITRYLMGLGSSDYSFEHESEERIDDYSIKTYNIIMNNETVIFYTHQANFAQDRLANKLIYKLADLLEEQDEFRIVFLPAEKVVKKAHELQFPVSEIPHIASSSLPDAYELEQYNTVIKVDYFLRDSPLSFIILQGPAWMSIDNYGLLSGIPSSDDKGNNIPVSIKVENTLGYADTLNTILRYIQVEYPPVIDEIPLKKAYGDIAYKDTIEVKDLNANEKFIFSLLQSPEWMLIDEFGVLGGKPSNSDKGSNIIVSIKVEDSTGLSDTLHTSLDVELNEPPSIITSELIFGVINMLYDDRVEVMDPDNNEKHTFELLTSPDWMSIDDNTGELSGFPGEGDISEKITITVKVTDRAGATGEKTFSMYVIKYKPIHFFVYPPYPNPFNNTTTIKYEVPVSCDINVTIYDILGRAIKEFREANVNVGIHEIVWDAKDDDGKTLSGGVYIFQVNSGNYKYHSKMVLVK